MDNKLRSVIKDMEYPKNLLTSIFCWWPDFKASEENSIIIESILNDTEKLASLEYVISTLPEHEQEVLHGFFRDKLTYNEMLKLPHLKGKSTSRIPQYLDKAIHKLKIKRNISIITLGIKEFYQNEINDIKAYYDKIIDDLHEEKGALLYSNIDKYIRAQLPKTIDQDNYSTQINNCFRRAGMQYVWQLYISDQNFLKDIRNLGAKSLKEIVDSCKKLYGFDIIEDRYDENFEAEYINRLKECRSVHLLDVKYSRSKFDNWLIKFAIPAEKEV